MKNTDVYGENHHLKVENMRLKSENKKLLLEKEINNKQLTLYGVVARLLKNYNTDTLLIEIDSENKGITVTKCTLSEDYYADYDYEHLEELKP